MTKFHASVFVWFLLLVNALGNDLVPSAKSLTIEGDDSKPQLSQTITVKNTSGRLIHIKSIKTSCGCTAAKVQNMDLAADDIAQIEISIDTAKIHGEKELYVIIATDSVQTPLLPISVFAKVHSQIDVSPNILSWNRGETDTKTILISARDNTTFQISKAIPGSEYFAPSLSTVNEGKSYKMAVTPSSNAPLGKSVIRLLTDSRNIPFVLVPVEIK